MKRDETKAASMTSADECAGWIDECKRRGEAYKAALGLRRLQQIERKH